MEVLHPKCGGLDVHKQTVVACARIAVGGKVTKEIATFSTTTSGLWSLSDWLSGRGITHVAMEATGVYWKPVWHVLDGSFELLLANARHVRNVPGRKTDVNDAEWLADLHAHGLIRASFVPDTEILDLRPLTRTRKQLVQEKARHVQRIHKVLEDVNIKLTSAIGDVMGMSGRKVLCAIIDGHTDPEYLVSLTSSRLKAKPSVLVESQRGHLRPHHRFMLRLHLGQVESVVAAIEAVEEEVGEGLRPFREATELLATIPGVQKTVAQVIIAELGADMSRFPDASHLRSWAGLCPRNDQSVGKRCSTRIRKGAPWLKAMLVQAAWSAVRKKDTYYRANFYRLRARRGPKKAIVAVAASMLTAVYYMLRDGLAYRELATDHFEKKEPRSTHLQPRAKAQ